MKRSRLRGWKFLVTGFGVGYLKVAPGTMGALLALIPAVPLLLFSPAPFLFLGILILLFFVLGAVGACKLQPIWGEDPSRVVIDEMVGMWISLMWLPVHWIWIGAAFILFRFFDIYKPLFIKRSEKIKGGVGVMADDVLAGVYTNLILQFLTRIISL